MRSSPELQEQLTKLAPYKEVHDNPHVQRWVGEMNDTLIHLETALMRDSFDSKEMKEILRSMGATAPRSSEEELVLYKAFRLVLAFMRVKLNLLEIQSTNYDKTKRKLIELGRDGDLERPRNVPTR